MKFGQNLLARGYTQVTDPRTTRARFHRIGWCDGNDELQRIRQLFVVLVLWLLHGLGMVCTRRFGTDWGIFYPWYASVGRDRV